MTSQPQNQTAQTEGVIRLLATLQRLTVRAGRAESLQALHFMMLNDSIELLPYDRAFLFVPGARHWTPRLASGQVSLAGDTQLAADLGVLADGIADHDKAQVLPTAELDEQGQSALARVRGEREALHLLWLPIQVRGVCVGALWLERSGQAWGAAELQVLQNLAEGYGAAWQTFVRKGSHATHAHWGRRIGMGLAALALAYVLFLYPFHLRITAPCEVVPSDPYLVAAPQEGVVEEIRVAPGAWVEKGAVLFVYDSRIAMRERSVADKQLQISAAELKNARARALRDDSALSDVAVLQHRVAQDRIRLELADLRIKQLVVRAPVAGMVRLDRPEAWRGAPVHMGQRVMQIVDPAQSRVEIWISENDHVSLKAGTKAQIFLHAMPQSTLDAKLSYIAPLITLGPQHLPRFRAEAEWTHMDGRASQVALGLKGTAILQGPPTTVAYWLVRRPWLALRHFFGI